MIVMTCVGQSRRFNGCIGRSVMKQCFEIVQSKADVTFELIIASYIAYFFLDVHNLCDKSTQDTCVSLSVNS